MRVRLTLPLCAAALLLVAGGCGGGGGPTAPDGDVGVDAGTPSNTAVVDPSAPPLQLESIGVVLGPYDPSTGRAGDFFFTSEPLTLNRVWVDFGFVIPGSRTDTGLDKANPQPTFIVPLGTPVRSLVDGVVVAVSTVWSGDFSIQVAAEPQSPWIYETEHVINPRVAVGDRVTAGQVIAEVSPFDARNQAGMGVVEIGILRAGAVPEHVCPFQYLAPGIRAEVEARIRELYAAWEAFRGDPSIYDEASMPVPGCLTLDAVPG